MNELHVLNLLVLLPNKVGIVSTKKRLEIIMTHPKPFDKPQLYLHLMWMTRNAWMFKSALLLKTGQRKGVSRCSKLYTTKLERKAGMERGKRNQSHRQIEILVFLFLCSLVWSWYALKNTKLRNSERRILKSVVDAVGGNPTQDTKK